MYNTYWNAGLTLLTCLLCQGCIFFCLTRKGNEKNAYFSPNWQKFTKLHQKRLKFFQICISNLIYTPVLCFIEAFCVTMSDNFLDLRVRAGRKNTMRGTPKRLNIFYWKRRANLSYPFIFKLSTFFYWLAFSFQYCRISWPFLCLFCCFFTFIISGVCLHESIEGPRFPHPNSFRYMLLIS